MGQVVPRSAEDFDGSKAWKIKDMAEKAGHTFDASPRRTLLWRRRVMPSTAQVDPSKKQGDHDRDGETDQERRSMLWCQESVCVYAAATGTKSTIFEASLSELMERRRSTTKLDGDSSSGDENVKPDFRAKYLGRLSYSRAWTPRVNRPPDFQTVTIFDWDDTLLCTSFLNDNPRVDMRSQLRIVASLVLQLLTQALSKGHVFIVTNAVDGWVQHSAQKYIPEVVPMLDKVHVISARSKFERHFPDRVDVWKVQAFLEVQRQLDSDAIANLISVGDSHFEMQAVHAMGRQFEEAVVKTVKLWERPSPEDLRRELELVLRDFYRIVEHPTSAKIGFERKRKSSPTQSPSLRPAASPESPRPGGAVAKSEAQEDDVPTHSPRGLGA